MHAFFTYFFCVVVYFVILATNETFLTSQLSNYEISFTEYDQIEYYKILGYVAGAIFLLMFSTVFSLMIVVVPPADCFCWLVLLFSKLRLMIGAAAGAAWSCYWFYWWLE
jgi:hypothetical protein